MKDEKTSLDNFNNRNFLKLVAKVALPIAAQSLIASSLNLIDNLMVGNLGELSLNAVGVSVQVFMIYWMFIFGFTSGAATFISQFYGVKDFHNIRLVFTDGEELSEEGVSSQGAYALAQLFKKLSIVDDDIFVFDSIGRGTIPVICESSFPSRLPEAFLKKYQALESRAIRILKAATGKWFKLPAGFSDNAGFLANGIPAVAITMLPSTEIELYSQKLLETKVTNYDIIRNSEEIKPFFPKTWKMFHTQDDNIENLDDRAFPIMEKILDNLRLLKAVAERK